MKTIILTLIFLLSITMSYGHGDEDHSKSETEKNKVDVHDHVKKEMESERASFEEFPTLHPLVVHFPVVLLLLAFVSQAASMFVFKDSLSWVTLLLIFGGLLGAYIAGEYVHPHLGDISDSAAWTLEQHEKFADYTLYSALLAFITKIVSLFFLKKAKWIEALTLVLLALSAYSVSEAGHYGAQLTHIEDVKVETGNHNH